MKLARGQFGLVYVERKPLLRSRGPNVIKREAGGGGGGEVGGGDVGVMTLPPEMQEAYERGEPAAESGG